MSLRTTISFGPTDPSCSSPAQHVSFTSSAFLACPRPFTPQDQLCSAADGLYTQTSCAFDLVSLLQHYFPTTKQTGLHLDQSTSACPQPLDLAAPVGTDGIFGTVQPLDSCIATPSTTNRSVGSSWLRWEWPSNTVSYLSYTDASCSSEELVLLRSPLNTCTSRTGVWTLFDAAGKVISSPATTPSTGLGSTSTQTVSSPAGTSHAIPPTTVQIGGPSDAPFRIAYYAIAVVLLAVGGACWLYRSKNPVVVVRHGAGAGGEVEKGNHFVVEGGLGWSAEGVREQGGGGGSGGASGGGRGGASGGASGGGRTSRIPNHFVEGGLLVPTTPHARNRVLGITLDLTEDDGGPAVEMRSMARHSAHVASAPRGAYGGAGGAGVSGGLGAEVPHVPHVNRDSGSGSSSRE